MPGITWPELCERVGYELIYAKLWGSRSHNTHLPESDWDYMAVYRVPTRAVLGIDPFPETRDGKDPDYEAHEVGKFCQLLLKGNPGILEMLFTDRGQYIGTPAWEDLVFYRDEFITQRAVSQYLGYAGGQLKRLDEGRPLHTGGGTYNTKWAYHIARLCADARRMAQGKGPRVWKDDDTREYQYLMLIRQGKVPREAITERLQETLAEIGDVDKLPIPREGPRERLNEWLLRIRGL